MTAELSLEGCEAGWWAVWLLEHGPDCLSRG